MPEAECWGKGWRRKDVHLPDETFPFMGQAARGLAACSLSLPWWRAQRGVRAFQCGLSTDAAGEVGGGEGARTGISCRDWTGCGVRKAS